MWRKKLDGNAGEKIVVVMVGRPPDHVGYLHGSRPESFPWVGSEAE